MPSVLPWYAPVARAVPAIAVGVWVAFTADHSSTLGLLALGVYGSASGIVIVATALTSQARGIVRGILMAQGLLTVATGVIALALPGAGLPFFVFLLSVFAAITGFLELYLGLRGRGRDRSGRDWLFAGALTAVLAVVVLLVPPELEQPLGGLEQVEGTLTASVIVVGVLGAYLAVLGVYLVIAGLSLKWDRREREQSAAQAAEGVEA